MYEGDLWGVARMATAVIVNARSNDSIDFNEVDIRSFIYPKVIIHRGR